MLNRLDRMQVINYVKAYFACLVSILSLYVIVDLFTNIDEFTQEHSSVWGMFEHAFKYYSMQVPQIFDRLCEMIVLLAAMFTVAMMQRNNELLPLLSAGISTRRVVLPILGCATIFLSLAMLNQELLMPYLGRRLMTQKDDPDNKKDVLVSGAFDSPGLHIEGGVGNREELCVRPFNVAMPTGILRNAAHLRSKEAYYVPPGEGAYTGGWLMTGTEPPESETDGQTLQWIDPGKYFLKTRTVDFETLTRPRKWYQAVSTYQLYRELQKPESTRLWALAVLFHSRLTRPLLGLILLVMGLSIILRDQNRNIFISTGLCLGLCGIFFAAIFSSQQLGENDFFSPALAAWLPVLGFGPLAFVMFDAVHT